MVLTRGMTNYEGWERPAPLSDNNVRCCFYSETPAPDKFTRTVPATGSFVGIRK